MTLTGWLSWKALRLSKETVESLSPVLLRQLEIVDKATALAAASDLQAYQGIQVMSQPVVGYDGDNYDPSEVGQAKLEAERLGLDLEDLNAEGNGQLRSLFE